MEYLELPDGTTSYLHLLENKNTIWDINNQPNMYEVEILHDINENFDKNFDDIINMNKIYCCICNLDVPRIYLKHHNKSLIHQNLIKLTDEVLERMKKHLKTNNELTNTSLNVTDTFFCDICSKIIQNNNRKEHFESKFHKKQAIFEKLLSFFVEAYLRVNEEDAEPNWEDLKDYMDDKNESSPCTSTSDLPDNISKDPSQIQKTPDPKVSDSTDEVPVINIFHPDYLKELLESGRNESSNTPGPQSKNEDETRNLPTTQTSMELSNKDPRTGLNPVLKDNKSKHFDNHPLNPMNPHLNPTNPNFPHINPMNPNFNPMNSIWNPMNPNFNPMHSNWNPVNPNFNAMHPNLHPMHPYFNPINPYVNPMNPNLNPMDPNFNPMNPNFNPYINSMNPNLNSMDPRYKKNPNLNSTKSNLYPMTPNLNPINPNFHPMDPRNKLGPNLITIKANLNPINPNLIPINSNLHPRHKSDPNLHPTDSSNKLDTNLNPMEHQPKLSSNLNTLDPQFKPDPNVNTTDPVPIAAETKKLIKSIEKAERKREKQMKNLQAFEEFTSYIKTIQDKYSKPGFKIEAVTVSNIKITALNGDCVVVSRENFQSSNKKYCRVCQNGNLGKDHEMSEEHISRIMVPVADKNCIREIDDIWSHCIICNELIKFVEEHNKTAAHLANLKGCFINIPKQKEETDNYIVSEEGINILHTEKELNDQEIKVPDEEESRNVVAIEKTVNAQDKKVPYLDIDKFSNTLADKLLPLFAKYALSKENSTVSNESNNGGTLESENIDSVVFKVIDIKNKVKELKESIQNEVDKDKKSITAESKKLDDEVASKSSSTSKNITKYCSTCKVHVTDFEKHKTSDSHTEINNRSKELKKIINRNSLKEIKDNIDILKCDICEVIVNNNFKQINEHVYSQNHRRNYFKFIESNKIILIDQVESQCEPCNKSIHRINLFDHCRQEKHAKKLKDFINVASSQTKPTQTQKESKQSTEHKTVAQNDIDVTKMLYHFRAQDVEYLCKTCHVLVSRDAASVKGHVESKNHAEKYSTLLRSNKMFKTKGSYYCEVCDTEIPMTGEITHVYGRNHIDNLGLKAEVAKDESNGTTASKANVSSVAHPVASTSKEVPISSEKIEITFPLYIKYQYKNLSEPLPICIICEQKVPNAEIVFHANSTTHHFNFNLIMINNTIKIKGNMYFCVNCNTSVPVFGEIQHIFGKSHLNNKKKQQPIASKGTGMLTYDHVLNLTQGKRMVKL